jgi:hypothetical protein
MTQPKPTGRGGPYRNQGRRPMFPDSKTLAITMSTEQWEWCRMMGNGNASGHMRSLVEADMEANMERVQQEQEAEQERLRREQEAKAQERIAPEVQRWLDAGKEAK